MIRYHDTAVLDRQPTTTTVADCPTCGGEGATGRHVYGRTAAEPIAWTTCGSCAGTGLVSADLVVKCAQPGCGAPLWADEACTHGMDSPLCADHAPAGCVECHGTRGDR